MRKLHSQLPANIMGKLYYSLVYSHLIYALLTWGRIIKKYSFIIKPLNEIARSETHKLMEVKNFFARYVHQGRKVVEYVL